MQTKLPIAVLCGALLMTLAACGGSGDGARITELEADLVAEQEARELAEDQAAEAEEKRQAEETARLEAEAKAAAAAAAAAEAAAEIAEANEDAAEAEQLRLEAEAARQAAEAERARLATAAEERRKADAAERARTAIAGHIATADPLDTLAVGTIKHGEPAPVTNPAGPFTTTSTGRSGVWSTTSLTAHAEPTRDIIEIYSDVEAPTRESFRTSDYNTDNDGTTAGIDGTGMVVGHVDIENATGGDDRHSRVAASGSFPRDNDNGLPVPFSLVDRGITETQYDALDTNNDGTFRGIDADGDGTVTDAELAVVDVDGVIGITRQQYNQYRADRGFREMDDFPLRYAYTTNGQLQGASGRYRCNGASANVECTVQNRGGSFQFGPATAWDFIPSSGTVQIVVPDAEYMWFGVWARRTVRVGDSVQPTELWRFEAHHGGNAVTGVGDATGSATYQGPAAGRYAVYEPDTGDSGIGSFTASATLHADFDSSPNTVSGTITGFSNDPSWSLALKRKDFTGGTVAAGTDDDDVTWTIDGLPDDSGSWEARFYANLPIEGGAITYQPHGIAGTFQAEYDPSGVGARAAVIGGFGARR